MKATFTIEADAHKLQLLLRVAEEMGVEVVSKPVVDDFTMVSEPSLAEDWGSAEDARWDVAYAHLKK